jgi:iron complex outermembrane recepter protein
MYVARSRYKNDHGLAPASAHLLTAMNLSIDRGSGMKFNYSARSCRADDLVGPMAGKNIGGKQSMSSESMAAPGNPTSRAALDVRPRASGAGRLSATPRRFPMLTSRALCVSVAVAVSLAALSANSAEKEASSASYLSDPSGALAEVVVTAQKRSEPLQKVPEAVSAVTGAALEAMGADSFTDYARTIPGLTFTDLGAGREKLSLRGLNTTIGADTVGYYIGEIPVDSAHGGQYSISSYGGGPVNPYLLDIDRIEVLRGPQGTLYGSGSMGGTLKLVPNAPNLTRFEGSIGGSVQVTEGEGGASPGGEADLVLNLPIVDGVAGVRAVFWGRDLGGFIDRTYGYAGDFGSATPLPKGTVSNVPTEHTWGMRTTGLVKPMDRLEISAMVYLQKQHFDGFQDITGGATNPNNRLQQVLISNQAEPQNNQFTLYGLTASYDFDRFKLLSATSYYDNSSETHEEGTSATVLLPVLLGVSDTPAAPFPNTANVRFGLHTFTEEARISTTESIYGFDAIGGIFCSSSRQTGSFNWSPPEYNAVVAGNDPANPLYAPGNDIFGDSVGGFERQTAEFGELTYHVTEALRATAGLRHFKVSNGSTLIQHGLFVGNVTSESPVSASAEGTVYKGNLSYNLTPDHLLYAQYSEGFRPGFGNGIPPDFCDAPASSRQVEPDSIKQYELGAKTQWLNKSLTVNTDVYRINWSGIQQAVLLPCGFGYTANSGDAQITGAELEVNQQVTNWLSAGLSGSYIRARLQQNTPANACLATGSCARAGDQIQGVPNWQYALYAQTRFPIGTRYQGSARLDYQYTGHSFGQYIREVSTEGLPVGAINPDYEIQALRLLNLKLGIHRDAWNVSFTATNLLNQVVHQSVNPFSNITITIPGRPRYVVNRPRTYLLNATYDF